MNKVRVECHHLSSSQWTDRNMKVYLLLLLLLPLCSAETSYLQCYGEDFFMVRNMRLECSMEVQQACYTRSNGEKGCTGLENCKRNGWNCCYTNLCNA